MFTLKTIVLGSASVGLLFLGACGGGNQINTTASSPASSPATSPFANSPSTIAAKPTPAAKPSGDPNEHGESQKGGQVVESGPYHLEFVPEKEAEGTHLDVYLQKGNNHTPIPDAKVSAQVQMADGSQKAVDLKYDPQDKHYTAIVPGLGTGEYKVAILSDINGEKVNGRFTFKQ